MKLGNLFFIILLSTLTVKSTPTNSIQAREQLQKIQLQKRTLTCSPPNVSTIQYCNEAASAAGHLNVDVDADLKFFKTCIAEFYCFQKPTNQDVWTSLPTFRSAVGTAYFNSAAKRVEMFFIQNNVWSQIMANPKFFNTATGACTNLLYVIAARHLYATYVLHLLRGERTFGPCDVDQSTGKLKVPSNGVCYPAHYGAMSCTSDHDIALIGEHSGSLTALFTQFFKEDVGKDDIVVGFSKTSEELSNTNVYAFNMEFAMPTVYTGLNSNFLAEMNVLNSVIQFQVQEVVCAMFKMHHHHRPYYNDLNSDSAELKRQPTKHNLFNVYQEWVQKIKRFYAAIKSFTTSELFTNEINFRRRQNIAYEMIIGIVENQGLSNYAAKAVSEVSIALLYGADTYHTRGAIRHVVGWTQMKRDIDISITDYWVSMVENWADTMKEYHRECTAKSLTIMKCLPKLSKFMWRMLDAMFGAYSRLSPDLQNDLMVVDNQQNTGVRSIVAHWFTTVKKKGLSEIPAGDSVPGLPGGMAPVDYFSQIFNCGTVSKESGVSVSCMNKIHNKIRAYNRALFINMVNSDPVV